LEGDRWRNKRTQAQQSERPNKRALKQISNTAITTGPNA
jgi:hypothetical protein